MVSHCLAAVFQLAGLIAGQEQNLPSSYCGSRAALPVWECKLLFPLGYVTELTDAVVDSLFVLEPVIDIFLFWVIDYKW